MLLTPEHLSSSSCSPCRTLHTTIHSSRFTSSVRGFLFLTSLPGLSLVFVVTAILACGAPTVRVPDSYSSTYRLFAAFFENHTLSSLACFGLGDLFFWCLMCAVLYIQDWQVCSWRRFLLLFSGLWCLLPLPRRSFSYFPACQLWALFAVQWEPC